MTKKYSDHIVTGEISPVEAIKNQSIRDAARVGIAQMIGEHINQDLPADAFSFGCLDTVAVHFVKWYGAAGAADVFRHYAAVCERQNGNGGA